jgi:2-polyprenyl-6-methoxyphenol hydroxylase-like FAD-dependent oxidoreductase
MSNRYDVDVLIVGAGPTGLTLACTLMKYGIDLSIIDKSSKRSEIPKASIMNARSMEVLYDIGALDLPLEVGERINDLVIYAEGEKIATSTYNTIDSPYNFALNIGQPHTEKALEDRLIELGCDVKRNCELIAFDQGANYVVATYVDANSTSHQIRCKYLVACDGAHSFVRRKLGLKFEGKQYPMDNLTGLVDVNWDFPRDRHLFSFVRDGAFIIYAMPHNHWLVWANMPLLSNGKSRSETEKPTIDDLQKLMDARCPFHGNLRDAGWITYYTTHERAVESMRVGRIFLSGDAAQISSPAGGEGMNTGIQDAHNLGFKLAYFLKGRGGETLLDSYDIERKVFTKQRKSVSDTNEKLFGLQGHLSQHIRNSVLTFVSSNEAINSRVKNASFQLSIGYRNSNVVEEFAGLPIHLLSGKHFGNESLCATAWLYFGSGPHAGDRGRECYQLTNKAGNDITLFTQLGGCYCHMLFFLASDEPSKKVIHEINEICSWVDKNHSDWIKLHLFLPGHSDETVTDKNVNVLYDKSGNAHARYGAKGECVYLIRPDGYIGYRSLPPNLSRLKEHISKFYDS